MTRNDRGRGRGRRPTAAHSARHLRQGLTIASEKLDRRRRVDRIDA